MSRLVLHYCFYPVSEAWWYSAEAQLALITVQLQLNSTKTNTVFSVLCASTIKATVSFWHNQRLHFPPTCSSSDKICYEWKKAVISQTKHRPLAASAFYTARPAKMKVRWNDLSIHQPPLNWVCLSILLGKREISPLTRFNKDNEKPP